MFKHLLSNNLKLNKELDVLVLFSIKIVKIIIVIKKIISILIILYLHLIRKIYSNNNNIKF